MATLIQQNFDLFSTLGADVRIPHSFADLCRNVARQERDIKNGGSVSGHIGFKVPMIKFVHTSYRDAGNGNLGLKDAKDIVNHYFSTMDEQRNIGGTAY